MGWNNADLFTSNNKKDKINNRKKDGTFKSAIAIIPDDFLEEVQQPNENQEREYLRSVLGMGSGYDREDNNGEGSSYE